MLREAQDIDILHVRKFTLYLILPFIGFATHTIVLTGHRQFFRGAVASMRVFLLRKDRGEEALLTQA